jgi:hypothetical protein
MPHIVMLALANPVDAEHEEKFNEWYEGTHIPQVRAAVPGITDVRRYRASAVQAVPEQPTGHRYLAVYQIEAADPGQVLAALGAGAASGAIEGGPAMDTEANPPLLLFYDSV